MSKITEELRELAQLACTLGKANGSVEVRTVRSPEYQDRELFKKLVETIQLKIDALARIPDAEYVAMVTGADKPEIAAKIKMFFKDGEDQEDRIGKKMFDEMETEKITFPEKEPQDSVEKDTVKV
jgi:hypothetical protein